MKRVDQVMKRWAYNGMLARVTRQTGARAVMREPSDEHSLADIWNIQPSYLPVTIRRTADGCVTTRRSDG